MWLCASGSAHALTNLALGGTASQKDELDPYYAASKAIDGNPSTFSHTYYNNQPWLEVDLGASYPIGAVNLIQRSDCCQDRLHDFYLFISDVPFTSNDPSVIATQSGVSSYFHTGRVSQERSYAIGGRTGRYVRVQTTGVDQPLHIAEFQIFSANIIDNGGFEAGSLAPTSGMGSYAYNPTDQAPWVFNGTSGDTGNNSEASDGPTIPEGIYAAYVQIYGTLSQTFTVPVNGSYRLAVQHSNRVYGGAQYVQVQIDGGAVANISPSSTWIDESFDIGTLLRGTHTLTFAGATGSDNTMLIDDVRMTVTAANLNGLALLGQYHLDEPNWSGAAGEVLDSSGSGHHGRGIGSPMPMATESSPAISGAVGTCSYATLPGPDNDGGAFEFTGLPTSSAPDDKTTVAMWMYWSGPDTKNVLGFGSYHMALYGYLIGFSTDNGDMWSTGSYQVYGGWHHIVAIFTNGDVASNELWIDGVRVALSDQGYSLYENSRAYVTSTLQIGGSPGGNAYRLTGYVDEVSVYNGALTGSQITALMNATHTCNSLTVPSTFNAFESGTSAGALTGVIHTKVAGTSFGIDLVAINTTATAVLTSFQGDVNVELLDAHDSSGTTTGSCISSWVPLTGNVPVTLTLAGSDAGRKAVNLSELDAWRNVRVRVSYPATGPVTAVGCSTDNFAIRPDQFISFAATDGTSTTAGTARSLANTGATGGVTHKAGRPFTISATAVNAVAGTTAGYAGTPTISPLVCGGTACVTGWTQVAYENYGGPQITFSFTGTRTVRFGRPNTWITRSFTDGGECSLAAFGGDPTPGLSKLCQANVIGTFSSMPTAIAGVMSGSATYSEAGSFGAQLVDTSFAAVDASDGSSVAERTIASSVINIGRFVPDHFDVASLAAPTLRTFDSLTCVARSFTYVGQPFGYATVAQATVLARNAAGATTLNYTDALWKLSGANITQTYTVSPATPALDATAVTVATVTSNGDGTGLVVGASGDKLRFTRPTASPLSPFNANIALAWSALDDTDVGVSGNGSSATTTPLSFSNIAFDAGKEMRFGAIRLTPAYGSELIDLPVLIEAQYWDGVRMATNTADQCTALPAASVAMNNYQRNLSACKTAISGGALTLANGRTWAKLKKPGNGNNGSVNVTLQLGAVPSGLTCTAVNAAAISTSTANMPWLQGKWNGASAFDQNPVTRASFGQYRSPLIYQRESF